MQRSSFKPSLISDAKESRPGDRAKTEYRPSIPAEAAPFAGLSVSTAQESNFLSDDLSDVLFFAFFVVVGAVAERSFDVNLTPFLQVLAAGLALLSPDHDGMPFGCLLLFPVRV